MKPVIITGSQHEIAETVARIDGVVREAIVFVDDARSPSSSGSANGHDVDIFAEMAPYTIGQADVIDARDAIYRRN